jgi:diketogulonate reductase-like aldo/keto reductase
MNVNYYTLSNKVRIPSIGYGTWKIPNGDETCNAIHNALYAGYRHIDAAAIYGNESGIGQAIKESGIDRKDIFITNKLWNTKRGYDKAIRAFKKSLKYFNLDYFDLYLFHWPASYKVYSDWKEINNDTWRAFETLYNDGLVRAIGVCNFTPFYLHPVLETAKIIPMINQIEYHPGQTQIETVTFCKSFAIQIEAWSPLGSGKIFQNVQLNNIAQKYHKSVAQICIRWCLQRNILPIPKSVTPERIKENIAVYDFELSSDDMTNIDSIPYFAGSGANPDDFEVNSREISCD